MEQQDPLLGGFGWQQNSSRTAPTDPENIYNNEQSQIQQLLPFLPGQAGSGSELLGLENSAGTEFGPCLMVGIIFLSMFSCLGQTFYKAGRAPIGFSACFLFAFFPQFS